MTADAAPAPGAVPAAETPAAGLTSTEVAERRSRGLTNPGGETTSRSVGEILRANILPVGSIVAAATFAAYALTRARGLPLAEQRTAATLVALILSLTVLVLQAIPLTWRRVALVSAVSAGFVLLFPVPAVRSFYALQLQCGPPVITLLIAALGIAALIAFWFISRRRDRGHTDAVAGGNRHASGAGPAATGHDTAATLRRRT